MSTATASPATIQPRLPQTLGQFAQGVAWHHHDHRNGVWAITGLGESQSSTGGFLLGATIESDLLTKTYSTGEILRRCASPYTAARFASTVTVPAFDETSRASGYRQGGITIARVPEGEQITASRPKFRQVSMSIGKLAGLCYVTQQLVDDAPSLGRYLNQAYPTAMSFVMENEIVNGSGAGEMLGVINADCTIVVDKETAQAADSIVGLNVINMWSRLWAPSRQTAVWICNQDTDPQLYKANLNADMATPIFQPASDDSGFARLMGRPVIPVEYCPTLGDKGDLILGDFSQYALAQKTAGVDTAKSLDLGFLTSETAFRFTYRCDGQPSWAKELTPYRGTNTLSPFVVLQARE